MSVVASKSKELIGIDEKNERRIVVKNNSTFNDIPGTVLAVAEAVLKDAAFCAASRGFELNDCDDVCLERLQPVVDGAVEVRDDHLGLLSDAFDMLLKQALSIERDIAARGYSIKKVPSFGRAIWVDDDSNTQCLVGAGIFNDGRPFIINAESEVVVEILATDVKRPLADRIRILSQLVCLSSDAVRFLGCGESLLRNSVSALTDAISAYRNNQANNTSDCPKQPSGNTENY